MLLHGNGIYRLLQGQGFYTAPQTAVTWLRNVEEQPALLVL